MILIEDKYIGKQFGCYEIISISDNNINNCRKKYVGKCMECGFIIIQNISEFKKISHEYCYHLKYDNIKKCLLRDYWGNSRIGIIFNHIIERCYNKNCKDYRFYGKNNIQIFNEWLYNPKLFEKWSLENGYQDNLTIDRIDETKDYCPENCRWITREENSKWKSTTNYIEVNRILDSGKGWAERLGLGINYINRHIRKYGMENTIEFIKHSNYFK